MPARRAVRPRVPRMPAAPILAVAVGTGALPAAPAGAAVTHRLVETRTHPGRVVERVERVTIGPRTSTVVTVTMPRPGRGRVLEPVLPGDVVSRGTATTSSVSRALGRYGTAVAINADLFEYASGQPSGLLMIDGEIYNQPQGGRPALAIGHDGMLSLSRPKAVGRLRLPDRSTVPFEINVRRADGLVTYDSGWGRTPPPGARRSFVARLGAGAEVAYRPQQIRATVPRMTIRGVRRGGQRIPGDDSPDFLFQAYGRAAGALRSVRPGRTLSMRYRIGPLPDTARYAVGGGPILIRGGRIVYRREANREFSDDQLVPPDARTAVAQKRNGDVIFYAVDRGSGSDGFTVAEVARDLKARGAVTAMAFDSGGSTAVSIDGTVLNRPADGAERPVGNMLVYWLPKRGYRKPIAAVRAAPPKPGSRVPRLSYRLLGATEVEINLHDPGGRRWLWKSGRARAGTHRIGMVDDPLPGAWKVEVHAPEYGDRVIRRFRVRRAPVAVTAPAAPERAADPPERAADEATARETAPGDATAGAGPWPWIAGGVVVVVAGVGLGLSLAARRRPRR